MTIVNSVLRKTESVHILVLCLFYDPLNAVLYRLFPSDFSAEIVYVILIFRKRFYISYHLILRDFAVPAARRNYKPSKHAAFTAHSLGTLFFASLHSVFCTDLRSFRKVAKHRLLGTSCLLVCLLFSLRMEYLALSREISLKFCNGTSINICGEQ